jgi:signal transduction histidine kinase
MIRTRLAVAFALLALLALGQSLFAWWAASSAAHHAERSVVATQMLAEYLELAGNKQRLKVWFAQRMLAGDAEPAVRDRLVAAMWASVGDLRALAERLPAEDRPSEAADVETIALNIATLERAVRGAERPGIEQQPAEQWRALIAAFDELSGRDMRELLMRAVQRQEASSQRESGQLSDALQRVRVANLLLAGLALAFAGVVLLYFVRRLDQPFARLAHLTEALAGGDFNARSGLSGRDEFARIGRLMDSMAERLAEAQARSGALQQQLDDLVAERTRALTHAYESLLGIEARRRQFFAELSHELRTPVTVIRGEADLALRNPGSAEEQRDALKRIVEASSELGARVQHLLEAARAGALEYAFSLERCSLPGIVAGAVAQMQAIAAHRGVALEFAEDGHAAARDGIVVEVDRDRLQQAIVIVLDNALRYSPAGRCVRCSVLVDADNALVSVDDEGLGMDSEELERAFEANFRGRAGRDTDPHGLGVGLAIARRIVEAQRGSIELQTRTEGGLRAVIALPLAASQEAPA